MRRAFLLIAASLASGCSFPSPEFESERSDATLDSGSSPDALVDGNAVDTGDTSVGDTSPGDTSLADTSPADSSPADTADASDPCDKDRDGYKAKGTTCGGNDCDDNDGRANAGVSGFLTFDATGKGHGGDWNCDGTVDRQFAINVSCGLLGGTACTSTKGFTGNPTCGTAAKYVQCVTSGALCAEGTTKTEIQGCK